MPHQVCAKNYRCWWCWFLGPFQNASLSVGSEFLINEYTIPLLSNINYLYFLEHFIFHRDLGVHQIQILCFPHLETRIQENLSTPSKCHKWQNYMLGSRQTHPRAPESYFRAIFTKTPASLGKFNCSDSYHEVVFASTMILPVWLKAEWQVALFYFSI